MTGSRPWIRMVWHPHQGLYNWDLLAALRAVLRRDWIYGLVAHAIILADTIVLCGRAVARRVSRIGIRGLFGVARLPPGVPLVYFDLGTHRHGNELKVVVDDVLPFVCTTFRAYAFEASRESFEHAEAELAGRSNVTLVHGALCDSPRADGKVRLYRDSASGLGDSVYRRTSSHYEEVDAIKLSAWMRENGIDLEQTVCLLRMNIEGAEADVISDLLASGCAQRVDGYFGMWDDLSKIDPRREDEFRALLASARIAPFTFNGRDLGEVVSPLASLRADSWLIRFRMGCIKYEIRTCVQAGRLRLEGSKH